jgi:hypothetical protein
MMEKLFVFPDCAVNREKFAIRPNSSGNGPNSGNRLEGVVNWVNTGG